VKHKNKTLDDYKRQIHELRSAIVEFLDYNNWNMPYYDVRTKNGDPDAALFIIDGMNIHYNTERIIEYLKNEIRG
jgi:hypothetical protein